jgi:hypothetical protein
MQRDAKLTRLRFITRTIERIQQILILPSIPRHMSFFLTEGRQPSTSLSLGGVLASAGNKMAATKPEILISLNLFQIEFKFQRQFH